jgi:hypothetical protein
MVDVGTARLYVKGTTVLRALQHEETMLTDKEIRLLKEQAKRISCLYWRDADGVAHRVRGVQLKWVEDKNEPELAEPVAVLDSGKVVALYNVELTEFFTLQPLTLGDGRTPTQYVDRVVDTLGLLCNGTKPPREMVEAWFQDESEELQDWAVNHTALCWGTGIGTIEAAIAMAETPEEGISGGNGQEHQMREEVFPREAGSSLPADEPDTTPLGLLKQALDISGIVYTVREDSDGGSYLFIGDILQSPDRLEGYTADAAPLEVLKRLELTMFEFEDNCIASC